MRWLIACFTLFLGYALSQKDHFTVVYQWDNINYTWRSPEDYQDALQSGRYIPEKNAMAGIKLHKDRVYIALPRIREGTPVTLASIPKSSSKNALLEPFPSWEMNAGPDCTSIQNVQSMEIDQEGTMWVIDGARFNNFTSCPPKLLLIDLNSRNITQTFDFPENICSSSDGFLNDIVVDSGSDYAYITEASNRNPGLIVYSRKDNKAWKVFDDTMLPEENAIHFEVDGWPSAVPVPIDGIAIDLTTNDTSVYYTPLTGFKMYRVNSSILKDEELCASGLWKNHIEYLGDKQGQSDGMVMDKEGNLFYGLLNLYGVGRWNKNDPFNQSAMIYSSVHTLKWPDSFGLDEDGVLYVLSNNIHKYFDISYPLSFDEGPKFNISRLVVG